MCDIIGVMRKRFTIQFTDMGGIPACKNINTDTLDIESADIKSAINNYHTYTVSIYDNHNKKDIGYSFAARKGELADLFKSADFIGANKNVVDFNQSKHHQSINQ